MISALIFSSADFKKILTRMCPFEIFYFGTYMKAWEKVNIESSLDFMRHETWIKEAILVETFPTRNKWFSNLYGQNEVPKQLCSWSSALNFSLWLLIKYGAK